MTPAKYRIGETVCDKSVPNKPVTVVDILTSRHTKVICYEVQNHKGRRYLVYERELEDGV